VNKLAALVKTWPRVLQMHAVQLTWQELGHLMQAHQIPQYRYASAGSMPLRPNHPWQSNSKNSCPRMEPALNPRAPVIRASVLLSCPSARWS